MSLRVVVKLRGNLANPESKPESTSSCLKHLQKIQRETNQNLF
ncbi:hypothetical protein [Helicobacter fennelliae]|uniref:Uncharacterized protein n=1 Tax=Helicobacter fennelliae MRY12-0050 TaxID=1325130 RepID=T1DVD3_9HELI|nr:hypothetical protein [Helicobacter fennelliae]GAD18437.1 hypothetical protein HFN_2365 [Helicobacter fennelliae MRY12-0050]